LPKSTLISYGNGFNRRQLGVIIAAGELSPNKKVGLRPPQLLPSLKL
jgi:hypothetical protein